MDNSTTISEQDINDISRKVAINIKRVRKLQRVKQSDLAQQLGFKSPQLCKIEKGQLRCTVGTLGAIATALDVDITEFYKPVCAPTS